MKFPQMNGDVKIMDQPRAIVCLVGENPLPVYLGAHQFADEQCSIVLIHSRETRHQAERIKNQLEANHNRNVTLELLANPYNAENVTELLTAIWKQRPDASLNYTGGTKVMAAFAVKQWRDDTKVFYLNEGEGSFAFANGENVELTEDIVDTEILCALHGVTVKHRANHEFEKSITTEQLDELFKAWPKSNSGSVDNRAPFMPDTWGDLGVTNEDRVAAAAERWADFKNMSGLFTEIDAPTSADALSKGKYKHQYKFAATAWLEFLILRLIEGCDSEGFIKGTYFEIGGQDFEADVLGVFKNRLYYLSCTTATTQKWLKAKAFEAVYRARQLGGGMARVAVVSFANAESINNVSNSLIGIPRLTLFGITDVESWIAGEMDSLRNFLES
jgi:hypothetical protein